MKEAINNNFSEINETPKFSNKKRLRTKNDNSTGVKTCPTTNSNSGNKLRKANPVVNKHIKKKRLQLSEMKLFLLFVFIIVLNYDL